MIFHILYFFTFISYLEVVELDKLTYNNLRSIREQI